MERLSSHTSSDDHKLYRSAEEIENLAESDPLTKWKDGLIADGVITEEDYAKLDQEIKERIRQEFIDAERDQDPSADELELEVTGKLPQLDDEVLPAGQIPDRRCREPDVARWPNERLAAHHLRRGR